MKTGCSRPRHGFRLRLGAPAEDGGLGLFLPPSLFLSFLPSAPEPPLAGAQPCAPRGVPCRLRPRPTSRGPTEVADGLDHTRCGTPGGGGCRATRVPTLMAWKGSPRHRGWRCLRCPEPGGQDPDREWAAPRCPGPRSEQPEAGGGQGREGARVRPSDKVGPQTEAWTLGEAERCRWVPLGPAEHKGPQQPPENRRLLPRPGEDTRDNDPSGGQPCWVGSCGLRGPKPDGPAAWAHLPPAKAAGGEGGARGSPRAHGPAPPRTLGGGRSAG